MQKEVIVISQKELTRYDVLRRVLDGTISLKDAAGYMGVSYRQAKRLKKDAKDDPAAFAHGNRGKSPSNKIDDARGKILALLFCESEWTRQSQRIAVSSFACDPPDPQALTYSPNMLSPRGAGIHHDSFYSEH